MFVVYAALYMSLQTSKAQRIAVADTLRVADLSPSLDILGDAGSFFLGRALCSNNLQSCALKHLCVCSDGMATE